MFDFSANFGAILKENILHIKQCFKEEMPGLNKIFFSFKNDHQVWQEFQTVKLCDWDYLWKTFF